MMYALPVGLARNWRAFRKYDRGQRGEMATVSINANPGFTDRVETKVLVANFVAAMPTRWIAARDAS